MKNIIYKISIITCCLLAFMAQKTLAQGSALDICNCDGSAGMLVAVAEAGTFDDTKTQVYLLTDTAGVIIDVNATGSFANVPTGTYNVYALNYDATDANANQITDNIELGDTLLNNLTVGVSEGLCYDLQEAAASVNQCDLDEETNLTATTCDPSMVGTNTVTLTNSSGCDSLVTTTTTLLASDETNLTATTCDAVNAGIDTVTLMNSAGCDSLVITTTTLLASSQTNIEETTCDAVNVGIDTVTLTNSAGCDSLVITNTILSASSETNIGGTTCDAANVGIDTVTLMNSAGCDSLVITNTTLAANDTTYVSANTCNPNLAGMTTETLQGQLCDSVVITTTTLLATSETNLTATTCDAVNVGVDTMTLTNSAGCDSLVITTATLSATSETNLTARTCDAVNVGIDTMTLTNSAGCDSLVITTTTLSLDSETNLMATTCDAANIGVDTVTLMNSAGCDSLVITNTTLVASSETVLPTTFTCDVNLVGTDTLILMNIAGCDSLVITDVALGDCTNPTTLEVCNCDGSAGTLVAVAEPGTFDEAKTQVYILVDANGLVMMTNDNGTFNNVPTGTYTIYALNYDANNPNANQITDNIEIGDDLLANLTIGSNDAPCYDLQGPADASVNQCNLDGETLLSATTCNPDEVGMDTLTLMSNTGCDSLVITTTTLLDGSETLVSGTTCNPANVGTDTLTLTNSVGCDSLVITTTVLGANDTTYVSATTCDATLVGMMTETLQGQLCDSVVITTTTLLSGSETTLTATTCDATMVGVDTVTLMNSAGCDSLVITTTTLAEGDETALTATTCDATMVGVDTVTLMNSAGCDSLVITTTTLADGDETTLMATTCDATMVGVDTVTLMNSAGCDSLVITTTTLAEGDETALTATTCDATIVGVDTVTLMNSAGCDSLVITTTTLADGDETALMATTCDATMVGVDTVTLMNSAGCDSLVITTTTLAEGDETALTATTCDATMVGVDTVTLMNSAGCDSLVITTTTLLASDETILPTIFTCDAALVGVDTLTLTNSAGCDSLVISTAALGDDCGPPPIEICLCNGDDTNFAIMSEPGSFDTSNNTQVYILTSSFGTVLSNNTDGNFDVSQLIDGTYDIYALNFANADSATVVPAYEVGQGIDAFVNSGVAGCYDILGPQAIAINPTSCNCAVDCSNVVAPVIADIIACEGDPTVIVLGNTGNWIINEVLLDPILGIEGDANGDGMRDDDGFNSDDEFVEIINDTNGAIDISGWTLNDAGSLRHTFPSGTIVPSGGAIVIFGGGNPTGLFGGAIVQTASTGFIGLNNGGDQVFLIDAGGNTVADVTIGAEGGQDQSLTLDPDLTGTLTLHTMASTSGGTSFSPGTQANGTPFSSTGQTFNFFANYPPGMGDTLATQVGLYDPMPATGTTATIYVTAVQGTCESEATLVNVTVETAPFAEIITLDSLCNVEGGAYPTTIDLSTLVLNGAGGIWINETGDTITTFDSSDVSFGDYGVTYTLNPTEGSTCSAVSYDATIRVINCGDVCDAFTGSISQEIVLCETGNTELVPTGAGFIGQFAPEIFISEIHYDDESVDDLEGVEITGTAGYDLANHTILAYNGNGGGIYETILLSGVIVNTGNGYGAIFIPIGGLQNGPDGLALVDDNGNVVEFLSYEDVITATDGAATGMTSEDIIVTENNSVTNGFSLQLGDNGWYGPIENTYDAINDSLTIGAQNQTVIYDFYDSADLSNLLASASSYDPMTAAGTIDSIWVVANDGACSSEAVVSVIIAQAAPSATVIDTTYLCNVVDGAFPTSINLDDLVVEGPNNGGTTFWSLDEMFVFQTNIDATTIGVDTLTYLYTILPSTDATECEAANIEAVIIIENCDIPDPCAGFEAPIAEDVASCEGQATAITPNGGGFANGSTTVTYNFYDNDPTQGGTLLTSGASYDPMTETTIWVTAASDVCESAAISVSVVVFPETPTTTLNNTTVCNDPLEGNTSVNLSSLIADGSTDGVFTDAAGNTVTSFDGNGLEVGENTFTYTVSSVCGNQVSTATVTVADCLLPGECPDLDAPIVVSFFICEGSALPTLTPVLGYLINEPFTYYYYDANPENGNANLLGTGSSFTNTGISEIWVTIIREDGCQSSAAVSYLNINTAPTAATLNNATVCNSSEEGNTIVDLASLIVDGGTNGIFTDDNGTMITSFDGDGQATGNYTITYTLPSPTGCGDATTTTTITVEDCFIPDPCEGFAVPMVEDASSCGGEPVVIMPNGGGLDGTVTYNFYDNDPANGGSLLGNGTSYELANTGTIWITAIGGDNCESAAVSATGTIIPLPSADINDDVVLCNNSTDGATSVVLTDLISNSTTDGTVTDADNNVVTTFDADGLTEGEYTFNYNFDNGCGDLVSFTITVEDCFVPDPCEGFAVPTVTDLTVCEGNSATILPSGGGLGSTVSYNFYDNDPANGGALLASGESYEPTASTTIWVTAIGGDNCESTAVSVSAEILPATPTATLQSDTTICSDSGVFLADLILSGDDTGSFTDENGESVIGIDGSIAGAGSFVFTYTIEGNDACGDNTYTTTVTVLGAAPMAVVEDAILCNEFGEGPAFISFSSLITDGDSNGVFTDSEGNVVTSADGMILDTGLYFYNYTLTGACNENVYAFTVEVVDCVIPPVCPAIAIVGSDNVSVCSGETVELEVTVENTNVADIMWSTGSTGTASITLNDLTNSSCEPMTQTVTATIPSVSDDCTDPTTVSFDITILPDPSNNVTVIEDGCSISVTACEGATISYSVDGSGLVEGATYSVNPPSGTTMMQDVMFVVATDCGTHNVATQGIDCTTESIQSIGNFVWEDENQNGVQDPGETGVEGVTVSLYNENGDIVDQTTTDANGFYGFFDVDAGNYYIGFEFPAGFEITQPNIGGNAVDSDVNTDGFTDVFAVTETSTDLNFDAGIFTNTDPCADFEAIASVVCNNLEGTYQIILTFEGGNPGSDGYLIIDNLTGATVTTTNNNQLFGPFANNAGGFNYTISSANNPECVKVVSASLVDCVVTSIELLEFDGEVKDDGNFLFWSTASERDNDYFTLMRSIDGENFEPINTQQGAGTSNIVNHYDFLDANAPNGFSYYRLDQTDFDGTTSRSNIVVLWRGEVNNSTMNIVPVPATNFINVSYVTESNTQVEIQIFDAIGRLVKTEKIEVIEGINQQQINISTYSAGVYFLTIQNGEETITEKFVKE